MSQAKVDRYKEEKANRKQIMAKEKRQRMLQLSADGWLRLPSSAGLAIPAIRLMRTANLWKPFTPIWIPSTPI